jgi:hypothetical protein
MRKANELKTLLNRIETIARREYRDIVGQLQMMLDIYEKQTCLTSERPYTRKELATTEGKPPTKVGRPKGSKNHSTVHKDGTPKKFVMTKAQRKNVSMGLKLSWARRKLAATTANNASAVDSSNPTS